jgi:hypothetical protein
MIKVLAYVGWFIVWFLLHSFVFVPIINASHSALIDGLAAFVNVALLIIGMRFVHARLTRPPQQQARVDASPSSRSTPDVQTLPGSAPASLSNAPTVPPFRTSSGEGATSGVMQWIRPFIGVSVVGASILGILMVLGVGQQMGREARRMSQQAGFDSAVEARLATTAAATRKQLPMMVAEDVQATSVGASGRTLTYVYHFTREKASLDIARMKKEHYRSTLNGVCTHPETLRALEVGVSIRYEFFDIANEFVMGYSVDSSSCKSHN